MKEKKTLHIYEYPCITFSLPNYDWLAKYLRHPNSEFIKNELIDIGKDTKFYKNLISFRVFYCVSGIWTLAFARFA